MVIRIDPAGERQSAVLAHFCNRRMVPAIAAAAVVIGAGFMETHQDPDNAPSDRPNMVKLSELEALLARLKRFGALAKAA